MNKNRHYAKKRKKKEIKGLSFLGLLVKIECGNKEATSLSSTHISAVAVQIPSAVLFF